jgi:hypothetical protein
MNIRLAACSGDRRSQPVGLSTVIRNFLVAASIGHRRKVSGGRQRFAVHPIAEKPPDLGGAQRCDEGGRVRFTVNGRLLELSAEDVRLKLRDVRPEPLHQYAIQIGLAIYPVKQAFEVATGVPRREFTTQVARRVFAALDFELIVDSGQSRVGEILQADVSDVVSSAAATPARDGDWHTEARVQAMLIKYLRREGWEIVRSADTARRERGIDIEATREIETVAIEVKGFPGRNYADPRRAGERKKTQPTTQAKGWVRPCDPGRDDRQDPEARCAGGHRVPGLSEIPRALPPDCRTAPEMRYRTLVDHQ